MNALADLPEQLRALGFVSGNEIAWKRENCGEAIDWLRSNDNAVLGIELWVIGDGSITTFFPTESGRAIYVTSCDPNMGETWHDYVERSAREASDAIGAFQWSTHALGPEQPFYFNLCWADREWFRTNSQHEAHFADE